MAIYKISSIELSFYKWPTFDFMSFFSSNNNFPDDSSTSTENEESSTNVSGLLSIRFQNDSTTPEMYFDQLWNPICAHHFADNDFGAELFCRKLGKIGFHCLIWIFKHGFFTGFWVIYMLITIILCICF